MEPTATAKQSRHQRPPDVPGLGARRGGGGDAARPRIPFVQSNRPANRRAVHAFAVLRRHRSRDFPGSYRHHAFVPDGPSRAPGRECDGPLGSGVEARRLFVHAGLPVSPPALGLRVWAKPLDRSVQGGHSQLHGIRHRADVGDGDLHYRRARASVRGIRRGYRGGVPAGFRHRLALAAAAAFPPTSFPAINTSRSSPGLRSSRSDSASAACCGW